MKKIIIVFLFGSITFLANAANWVQFDDLPDTEIYIDGSSLTNYKGHIIGGGNPSNYVSAFIKFVSKPGAENYKKGYGSATYQYLVDCNSHMSLGMSVLYRDLDDEFIRTTTLIESPKQSDFETPYPSTVNQGLTNLLCDVNTR